jgi:hypothetical protein
LAALHKDMTACRRSRNTTRNALSLLQVEGTPLAQVAVARVVLTDACLLRADPVVVAPVHPLARGSGCGRVDSSHTRFFRAGVLFPSRVITEQKCSLLCSTNTTVARHLSK